MNILKVVLIAILLAAVLTACCDEDKQPPGAPWGTPDDVSQFNSGEYRSISYTYYCLDGDYVSITYVKLDACSDWTTGDEYRSSGICY